MSTDSDFQFTLFHPDGLPYEANFRLDDDTPRLSGRGKVYVLYRLDTDTYREPRLHHKPEDFRLCIDDGSPLLRLQSLGTTTGWFTEHMMGWDIDTRDYANGPHSLTAAPWLYFQIQEGPSKTVEVVFDNLDTALKPLPVLPPNPNLPALLPDKQNGGA